MLIERHKEIMQVECKVYLLDDKREGTPPLFFVYFPTIMWILVKKKAFFKHLFFQMGLII